MSLKTKILIIGFALVLAAAVVSMVSADTNSILEFFGFGKPTATAVIQPEEAVVPKTQKTPAADKNPFSNYDPALVELETPAVAAKSSDSWFTDDWDTDPFADSFSAFSFDEAPQSSQKKDTAKDVNPYIFIEPTPSKTPMTIYRFPNNPVFRPGCRLPRTGFSTNGPTEIKENVTYAATNMSLSIPTMNLNEDIVMVPLVGDEFPVENLGSNIGLLEGSGPSQDDLFVLAGHNHLNTEEKGPFAKLSGLNVSDLIFVRGAKNASRTFVVYANEKFAEDDVEGLLSFAKPGCMILITCEDESIEGGYLNRRVVFAEAKED